MSRYAQCDLLTTRMLACWLVFVVVASQAEGAFIPLDVDWQYDAPAGTTIALTPGRVAKTYGITLTTTFTTPDPIVVTLRTTPMHEEDERFFMLNMVVTNNMPAGLDWFGFVIKTLDQIEIGPNVQDPNNIRAHPKWAHIHPLHSSANAGATTPTGPDYKEFSVVDPNVTYGVEVMTLLAGNLLAVGSTWSPERIRLHDKNALGDQFVSSETIGFDQVGPMEFQLVLQPLVVPEPGTFGLLGVGVIVLGAAWRRRARIS